MLKDNCEKYYVEQNYNCAESLLRGANDYYNLELHDKDMILVGAYGGGIQCGSVCGAVLSAVSVLSLKYVEAKAHESENIKPVVMKLIRKFNQKYASTLCKDIKPQSFTPERRCLDTVITACDILEETIREYEEEKNV